MQEQKPVKFNNGIGKWEKALGLIYLPVHIFLLPLLLGIFQDVMPDVLTDMQVNTVYYLIGLAVLVICLRKFLRGAFDRLLDAPGRSISAAVMGYLINMLLSYGAMMVLIMLGLDEVGLGVEETGEMVQVNLSAMLVLTVLAGPLVEETLFRGVLFGSLLEKNRVAAYVISVAVFCIYHVWQYLLIDPSPEILLYMIQFIPASFALCWCYERAGNVWAPIFLHMLINGISLFYLV